MPVTEYFTELARAASAALAEEFPDAPATTTTVTDAAQRSAAASWQALAVHPLQVLETGYQDVVRAAGASARTDDERRDVESEALSRFFALGSTPLLRLEVPPGALDTLLSDKPLVEDLLDQMASAASLVREKLDHPAWGDVTIADLASVVTWATRAVTAMAPAGVRAPLPAGVEQAARYLGMLDTGWSGPDAVAAWVNAHQNHVREADLQDLLATLQDELVVPLRRPDNAVAAVRALYNIESFTLVRLLHRFEGGTASAPMPVDRRRVASGLVTGAMHPATLTAWHEKQVAALSAAITTVDGALRTQLGTARPVTRFYLKGGRALFTALGTPELGGNDWDTGILIDPDLDPEAWYTAFAGVHDVVVRTLDGFRYGYTQELHRTTPATRVLASAASAGPDLDNAALSEAAESAEDQLHRAQLVRRPHLAAAAPGALGQVAQRVGRPAGVNGELVDVGIPTRSSVELLELWRTMTVAAQPGVSGTALPVPTLPYFVADLSTILREAVADEQSEPDHKLGKRLVRLATVLAGAGLGAEVARRRERLAAVLPRTVELLRPDVAGAAGRLQVITLSDLVDSQSEPPTADATVDEHLAAQLRAGLLYDERDPQVVRIWAAVEQGVAEARRAEARTLLSIQAGAHRVAATVLSDRAVRERGLGVDLTRTEQAGPWKVLVQALDRLARVSTDAARCVVSGSLGARLQLWHAGVADPPTVAPVDRVTVDLWLPHQDAERVGVALCTVRTALSPFGDARVVGEGPQARAVLRLDLTTSPTIGTATGQVALVVRPVAPGDAASLDVIRGWSVTPTRRLVEQYLESAAAVPDFDLREAEHAASSTLLRRVLGHAVGPVRTGRAF